MNYRGYLIYRTRIQKNWSQAGLCKGICTVSYLSKIETGKAEPSEEIERLLLQRLDLEIDQEIEREAAKLANQSWELLFAGRFAKLSDLLQEQPTLMSLHKLAICCEKTGRREQALSVLRQAEVMDTDELEHSLAMQLLRLVRYRVEHPDYLTQEEYGSLLLGSFTRLQRELPSGFAIFHLPWVLEWYKATRQYKKACELLEEFPGKTT